MRNLNDKKKKFRRRLGYRIIGIALIILGIMLVIDVRIRPIIEQTSSYQSRVLVTRIINTAVYEEINQEFFDYAKLVNLGTDVNGNITSIESNMININKLKTMIVQEINEEIKDIERHNLSISLGTLSGIEMFYSKGPSIPILVRPNGYVEAQLISEFTSGGINQTRHRIILEIDVDMSAIIPGYTTSVKVNTNFILAETVIVGVVPESYTHVITGDSDLLNYIDEF